MERRDVLKLLAGGAIAPSLSSPLFGVFREVWTQVGATPVLRTLNPHQNATVVAMADLMIPETDTPGAKGARVNEFVDVILTEWATEEERRNFLSGVEDVDKQSNELFGKNFVDASPAQQTAQLRAMDDAADFGSIARKHGSAAPNERDTQLKGNFFVVFKGITLHGYYTSEIGFSQELKEEIIPGSFHGCVPVPVRKKA